MAAAPAPESTRKAGLMIGIIALVIVLGAVGYFGYRMLSTEGKETVAVVEPPKPAETPPPPTATPAADMSATRDTASTAAPASPSMVAPSPATAIEPSRAIAPAPTGVPLPGRPPTAPEVIKTDSGPTKVTPSKASPKRAPSSGEAPSSTAAPAATPSPAPSKALAKAPTPAPAPDRWQGMAEAMAQCHQAPFFSRLACEQRTRNRYCEGYWGQVSQCPSAPAKDHGQ